MSKVLKKGRNPGAADSWLDSLGLYRKNVAYDETCLFRAVSEQVFDCQIHHERVRMECIEFGRRHYSLFQYAFKSEEKWLEHLDQLKKHMVVCGDIEIDMISRTYNRDIIIFNATEQKVYDATKRNEDKAILLCFMDKDHYDAVYRKDQIAVAGFCQSMVYKLLYEEVFQMPRVDEIVHNMLYERTTFSTQAEMELLKQQIKVEQEAGPSSRPDPVWPDVQEPLTVAPFPFKVAKALDPNIYRNIEYDTWGEVRRELRLSQWYYGDDKLILGTRCNYNDILGLQHDCYIQELIKDENRCVIYLTKLAQKRTVNYSDLSPENDAKPWPLPYRFMKNLAITQKPFVDTKLPYRYNKKKKQEKKRTKSESSVVSVLPSTSETIENYVGAPLQMQPPTPVEPNNNQVEATTSEPLTAYTGTQATENSSDPTSPQNRYTWQPFETPVTPSPFVWPQAPQPFNYKTVVASAPVTPDVIPYHDVNNPFYYNYHVSNVYPPQNYPWLYPPTECQQPPEDDAKPMANDQSEQQYVEVPQLPLVEQLPSTNGYEAITQQAETACHERPRLTLDMPPPNTAATVFSPQFISVPPGLPLPLVEQLPSTNGYEAITQQAETACHERPRLTLNMPPPNTAATVFSPQFISVPPGLPLPLVEQLPSTNGYEAITQQAETACHERPRLTLNMPPPNTAATVFSPQFISVPPGTPVMYAVPPPELPDAQMMYASPAVDAMNYMSRSPFVYPPTPPPTWYSPSFTPQGFIFPPQF